MTLTDAGPLVALIDADEQDHELCVLSLKLVTLPMVTTWPAFTEAMYLLGRAGGLVGQNALWRLRSTSRLEVLDLSEAAIDRSEALMKKCRDRPMDLADATLVALAEEHNMRRVFTLDDDFRIYRIHGTKSFEIIPTPRR